MIFMTIDMTGGIFSLLSLVFREEFDVIASITYACVIVLDGIVILCAIILNPRAKRRRARLGLTSSSSPTAMISGAASAAAVAAEHGLQHPGSKTTTPWRESGSHCNTTINDLETDLDLDLERAGADLAIQPPRTTLLQTPPPVEKVEGTINGSSVRDNGEGEERSPGSLVSP